MKLVTTALVALSALLIAQSASAADGCDVPGAADLLKSPATKYIMVGETHGTQEGPAVFGDLVCTLAKSGRGVVVGLEFPEEQQALMDQFLASDGGPAAIKAFLQHSPWNSSIRDGRSSRAMLALMRRLRSMYRQKTVAGVRYIASNGDNVPYNHDIATAMLDAGTSVPGGVVVVLVGIVHATKQPLSFGGPSFEPAAMLLPADAEISLSQENDDGQAWNCISATPDGCGPHPAGTDGHRARGVYLGIGTPRVDGLLASGLPATASPPVSQLTR